MPLAVGRLTAHECAEGSGGTGAAGQAKQFLGVATTCQ